MYIQVAVSNPSVLDNSLCKEKEGSNNQKHMIVHAYGAGNEDWNIWGGEGKYISNAVYQEKKMEASAFLYRSVGRALGIAEEA